MTELELRILAWHNKLWGEGKIHEANVRRLMDGVAEVWLADVDKAHIEAEDACSVIDVEEAKAEVMHKLTDLVITITTMLAQDGVSLHDMLLARIERNEDYL